MDAAVVETIGSVSHLAPAGSRNRTWPRGIGRRSSPRSDDDQPSILGNRLSVDIWIWNRCGNDADHSGDCDALRIFHAAFRTLEPRPRHRFRTFERRVRSFSLLSDGYHQRIVCRPTEMDSTLDLVEESRLL